MYNDDTRKMPGLRVARLPTAPREMLKLGKHRGSSFFDVENDRAYCAWVLRGKDLAPGMPLSWLPGSSREAGKRFSQSPEPSSTTGVAKEFGKSKQSIGGARTAS